MGTARPWCKLTTLEVMAKMSPSRKPPEGLAHSRKFKQIVASIDAIGLIEPLTIAKADKATGKKNLLYRLGKRKGKVLFFVFSLLASTAVFSSPVFGVPFKAVYLYLPVAIVSLFIAVMMLRDQYENRKTMELLCGLNIAVNLGTSLVYILAYI